MLKQHRVLAVICLATAAWSFSFGVAALAPVWMDAAGCSDTVIGGNTAAYYLGMALAAVAVPRLMRRWGNGCLVAGCLVSGAAVVLFPLGNSAVWWYAVRFAGGAAGALSLIPLEARINRDSPPHRRAWNFSLYGIALTLGYAAGNWFGLELYPTLAGLAFAVGGAVGAAAGLFVWAWLPASAPHAAQDPPRAPLRLRQHFLSYGSAWNQGFLEGVMLTFMTLHLRSIGLLEEQVAWLTSLAIVGILAFQIPVAWLADRLGRRAVLVACYGLVLAGLLLLRACTAVPWLAAWLFVVGGGAGALYTLGLALLGQSLHGAALDRANAVYLAIECGGCMFGPVVTGAARARFGDAAMFPVVTGALVLFLAAWAALELWGRRRRGPQGELERATRTAA